MFYPSCLLICVQLCSHVCACMCMCTRASVCTHALYRYFWTGSKYFQQALPTLFSVILCSILPPYGLILRSYMICFDLNFFCFVHISLSVLRSLTAWFFCCKDMCSTFPVILCRILLFRVLAMDLKKI